MMASIDGAVNPEYGCVLDEYGFEPEAERGARPKTFCKSEAGSTTNSGQAPARHGSSQSEDRGYVPYHSKCCPGPKHKNGRRYVLSGGRRGFEPRPNRT